ncbi:hypothetical protein R1sor_027464 [Riccia sorocarpa]|uniref:non-specific serine/threonine protein kinase n=1 Tax=Riccia sorocarpa TaxID=122646 RepID=A0ABD3GHY1_9MARC
MASNVNRPESAASDVLSTIDLTSEADTPYGTVHQIYDTVVHKDTMVHRVGGGGSSNSSFSVEAGNSGALKKTGPSKPQVSAREQTRSQSMKGIRSPVMQEDPSLKYDLLNELGKGSYGAVYKARDLRTSELVAIKVISLCEGEEGYEEIRGEIEMLQQCNHPNVVRYFGSYQGEDYLWIVMEYCGGGSVADIMSITDEPLEEHQIAYICKESLKGLAYLHSIFKVHRDIKGGNILLTEQGEVKLGDFGVAAQLTRTMSKRNTFIGTPHWMAPEVIQESRYDGKVDVWALGVSAIEMAEGLPPRSNVHPMRVLFMISREPAPMLEDKEKWSLVFHDFVAKCLTKEPRLRPTATSMLQHKFIDKCKGTAMSMLPKIEQARAVKVEMAAQRLAYNQDQGTASSGGGQWSLEKGQTVKMNESFGGTMLIRHDRDTLPKGASLDSEEHDDGDYGTIVVHGTSKKHDSASDTATLDDGQEPGSENGSPLLSPVQTPAGGSEVGSTARRKLKVPSIVPPSRSPSSSPSPSPVQPVQDRADVDGATLKRGTGDAAAGTPKGTPTLGRQSLALQDKLLSVYAAGNTVPIPFLKATDISPIALISDNLSGSGHPDNSGVVALEAIQELYNGGGLGEGQQRRGRKPLGNEMPLPPSVYQRLATSTTLPNLARALAYHKMCYEEVPLQGWQVAQEQQTIHNLSDTLRTILRL